MYRNLPARSNSMCCNPTIPKLTPCYHHPPPTTYVLPSATTYRLPPTATTYHLHQPPSTYHLQQPLPTTCRLLPPTAPCCHSDPRPSCREAGNHRLVDIELNGDEVSDQLVFVLKDESSQTW